MAKETPDHVIVEKLSDQEVLRNYCAFAGMHRSNTAMTLFNSLGTDENQRRSIGLEILGTSVAALEDVALWFFVLKEWKKGEKSLFDLLDGINVTEGEGHPYSAQTALDEMAKWTIADLRREFGLLTDEDLLERGWAEIALNNHINALRGALRVLLRALEMRTEDERILVTSYNKIKHGALAIATTEHSPIKVSVMLSSRRGPVNPASGKRKVNTGWIACEDRALGGLVNNIVQISRALWQILNFIYLTRFDSSWEIPPWPHPLLET